jgi:hypothetical protein
LSGSRARSENSEGDSRMGEIWVEDTDESSVRIVGVPSEIRTGYLTHECRVLHFFICGTGVESSPLLLRPFIGLLYQPCMMDGDGCRAISGKVDCQGKPKYSEKT